MAKEETPNAEQEVTLKMSDLESLKADLLEEAKKEANSILKEAQKKNFLNQNAESNAKLKKAELQSDTAKFFKALVDGDRKKAAEISAKSYGGQVNYMVQKSLNTSDDSELVPVEFARDLIKTMYDYSQIRPKALVRTMSSNSMSLNELTQKVRVNKKTEGANNTQSEPTFDDPTITAETYSGETDWTYEFQQDSEIDILTELRSQFAERFAAGEQNSFLNSAVVGSEGIMNVAGVDTYTLSGGLTSITAADIKQAGAQNGNAGLELYISRTALSELETFVDTNGAGYRELAFVRYDSNGNVVTIGGYPVNIIERDREGVYDMLPQVADDATGLKFAFLANLRNTFVIGDRANISFRITQDGTTAGGVNLTATGGKALIGMKRTGQKVVQSNQITVLTTAT